jgi:hypothetical protein
MLWSRNPHAKAPNDTVQPCDTNQARSDSDFGVKVSSVQFYAIEHNFKSNRWIELKLYQKIPEVFVYVGVHFQENPHSKRTCNISPNRLYEFCYLLPFDLWTFYLAGSFSYKDVGACFGNFLVPQGSLMSCNIISKCGKDSLMFQNPFLIRIPYSS